MAKRLTMTSADYLAIAVSPALIMALVGSLVFFLIEVLYVGQYQARMIYAFALFVFAAVLIARISIEMGSDHAAVYALPLGIVMFLFMLRFVEQPSAFGHAISLALLGLVWWCAHRLTWDSTVIDDVDDASGEGLMQRIGVDDPPGAGGKSDPPDAGGADDNELFAGPGSTMKKLVPWWQQPLSKKSGPHTPGLWVLYFSLAALPLFGIGQHWIPADETSRRRYVFVLLLVYVAAALALLVTTSFLNLRRYLRQRRVEMPLSIAGTWVGIGAILIIVVMLFAALIPRPGAEIALSRVPWQRSSSDDRQASRLTAIQDRGAKGASKSTAGGERAADNNPNNRADQDGDEQNSGGKTPDADNDPSAKYEGKDSAAASDKAGDQAGGDQAGGDQKGEGDRAAKSDSSSSTEAKQGRPQESSPAKSNAGKSASKTNEPERSTQAPTDPGTQRAQETLQKLSQAVGEISGLMKLVFYAILALLACFAVWNYRDQILQALADILSQLKALFGGKTARDVLNEANPALLQPPLASFRDFHDPFSTGQHTRMQPDELVRYTFAAFEAWANDHGRPRTPDCTPHEFVSLAVDPESPMYEPARQLVRLYGQMAYASRRISRQSAGELQALWQLMQSTHTQIAPGLSTTLHS